MSDHESDSFELFADTLTITLACIIFISLLLVTMTRSHEMDESGLLYVQRRSELLVDQIALAKESLAAIESELNAVVEADSGALQRLESYRKLAVHKIDAAMQTHEKFYADALLAENKRAGLFSIKLPWIAGAVAANTVSLDARIERTFAEASERAIALSILREQSAEGAEPLYWIVREQGYFPVPGGPGRSYPHVLWRPTEKTDAQTGERIWQLMIQPTGGLNLEQAVESIEGVKKSISNQGKRQLVLLVYADSFKEGRALLEKLSQMEVHFSWRPFTEDQRVLMSESGLGPEVRF